MKKVNPRKRPATRADVEKAKRDAQDLAVKYAFAIMLTVLVDKFSGEGYIRKVWDAVGDLSDSATKGYVTIPDLMHTLKTEYQIDLT